VQLIGHQYPPLSW